MQYLPRSALAATKSRLHIRISDGNVYNVRKQSTTSTSYFLIPKKYHTLSIILNMSLTTRILHYICRYYTRFIVSCPRVHLSEGPNPNPDNWTLGQVNPQTTGRTPYTLSKHFKDISRWLTETG